MVGECTHWILLTQNYAPVAKLKQSPVSAAAYPTCHYDKMFVSPRNVHTTGHT